MQPTLPEELRLLQRSVRQFVEEKLQPLEREIEAKDEISRPVIDAMAAMGLFGLGFSEDVGGQGFGKLGYCLAIEQAGRVNARRDSAAPRSTLAARTRCAAGISRIFCRHERSARTP